MTRFTAFVVTAILTLATNELIAEQFGDFTYSVIDAETVQITDFPTTVSGEISIPSEIESLPVTSIGLSAFEDCSSLTGIEIPDSVTDIGLFAVRRCAGLLDTELPSGLLTLGVHAFSGCAELGTIEIPDGVTEIGLRTFEGCTALTQIDFGQGLTVVGPCSFRGCTKL